MSVGIRFKMANNIDINSIEYSGKADKSEKNNRKTINATNLNLKPYKDNQIDSKRLQARKQAMKLISDAWSKDNKTDKMIDDMNQDKVNMLEEMKNIRNKISDIDNEKEAYRLEYGVDKDSSEQKDLELLEKYQNNISGVSHDEFSKEELNRLKELQNEELTEYQKKALGLNSTMNLYRRDYEITRNKVANATATIAVAKIDRDKSQGMLKADSAADEILKAAEEEVFSMLVEEGKENIEEKIEEEKEKAEEKQEKEEAQQERIEKIREERKEQQEILEGISEADRIKMDLDVKSKKIEHVSEAQRQIVKIIQENKLVNEDLKGIDIDLNF